MQKGGSQEHVSLITIMFYFNEFAFTVQVKHKINSIQILVFILICLYFTTGRFHTCVLCKECSLFAFSWLSFQRLCRLLWGLQSVDNTLQSAVPLERYPIGTKAQQNENMCPIRSKKAFVLTGRPLIYYGSDVLSRSRLRRCGYLYENACNY